MPPDETPSIRLARIEVQIGSQSMLIEKLSEGVEKVAVLAERLGRNLEDTKRMHDRIDELQIKVDELQLKVVEMISFYRDIRKGIWSILGLLVAGGSWLLVYWVENH